VLIPVRAKGTTGNDSFGSQDMAKETDTDSDFNPHPATLIAIAGVFFYFNFLVNQWLVFMDSTTTAFCKSL